MLQAGNRIKSRQGHVDTLFQSGMAFSGVDKFPLVAKILVDMRLQELVQENQRLKAENEKLKLMMFWQTHDISWLRHHIFENIQFYLECGCRRCNLFQDINGRIVYRQCCNLSFFEDFAEKHGFKVAKASLEKFDDEFVAIKNEDLGETWDDDKVTFYSGDAHFVLPSDTTHLVVLGYGERLSKARSVHDPEVVKLKKFFEEITKFGWHNRESRRS